MKSDKRIELVENI